MPISDTPEFALHIRNLEAGYGKHQILHGVDLDVREAEVIAVLGANGVGKTTLLNTISGFLKPMNGEIRFQGRDITGASPHQTFAYGIVQVSQGRDLFPDMTVEDNLRLGAPTHPETFNVEEGLQNIFSSFPRLHERRNQNARTLSGGEQQMLAIGRAVISRPNILLLDEPSAGLSPQFVAEIGAITETLKSRGTTMLLVEQNIALAKRVADRFLVLKNGVVGSIDGDAFSDPSSEAVKNIYL
jgi:branched-chain amino acid transport system ATP-binding protein